MINIKIDEETLLDMFEKRLDDQTDNTKEKNLYMQMYERYICDGVFDDIDLDINDMVDNDFYNYCKTIDKGDGDFDEILELYKQDYYDISCETDYAYIEAVDDKEEPTAFLLRCK